MVRGKIDNFKCSFFFSVCTSAGFFFLFPFTRPFMALLLIECLQVAVFAPL